MRKKLPQFTWFLTQLLQQSSVKVLISSQILISSHLIASHLISSHLISSHLISSQVLISSQTPLEGLSDPSIPSASIVLQVSRPSTYVLPAPYLPTPCLPTSHPAPSHPRPGSHPRPQPMRHRDSALLLLESCERELTAEELGATEESSLLDTLRTHPLLDKIGGMPVAVRWAAERLADVTVRPTPTPLLTHSTLVSVPPNSYRTLTSLLPHSYRTLAVLSQYAYLTRTVRVYRTLTTLSHAPLGPRPLPSQVPELLVQLSELSAAETASLALASKAATPRLGAAPSSPTRQRRKPSAEQILGMHATARGSPPYASHGGAGANGEPHASLHSSQNGLHAYRRAGRPLPAPLNGLDDSGISSFSSLVCHADPTSPASPARSNLVASEGPACRPMSSG